MSHGLIPNAGGISTGSRNLLMDEGGVCRAPRRLLDETSEKLGEC